MFKSGSANDEMDTLTIDLVIAQKLYFIVRDDIDMPYIGYTIMTAEINIIVDNTIEI